MSDKFFDQVNNMYAIHIGPSVNPDMNGFTVYKVVNEKTGVVEGESTILARAYEFANDCKVDYDELMSRRAAEVPQANLNS